MNSYGMKIWSRLSKQQKSTWCIYAVFAVIALIITLFSSECSPVYPINTWVDPNCFMTVGKAVAKGKVIYRDIYEQKGPYVYFFHALCYLISPDSFTGVWLFEVINCFFVMLTFSKILKLYAIDGTWRTVWLSSLATLGIYFSYGFRKGDSVEEFCLPMLLYVVYLSLKRIKASENFKKTDFLLIGFIAGIVFWMKFSIVGFFVGWYIFYLYRVFHEKGLKSIPVSVLFILLGVALATLPPLAYFGVNHSIKIWLTSYIYDNLFFYTSGNNAILKLLFCILYLLEAIVSNLQFTTFVVFGLFCFSRKCEGRNKYERMLLLSTFIATAFFIYIGGRHYRYYALPLGVFTIFGYIALAKLNLSVYRKKAFMGGVVMLAVVACVAGFFVQGHAPNIFVKQEDTAQYKFARIIHNAKEDATLLQYGSLDSGFYLATGVLPEFKYFCRLNNPLPEMEKALDEYLSNRQADFVIVRYVESSAHKELDDPNYVEITRMSHKDFGQTDTYILYALKE